MNKIMIVVLGIFLFSCAETLENYVDPDGDHIKSGEDSVDYQKRIKERLQYKQEYEEKELKKRKKKNE